jgi:hypothetical protein
MDCDVLVAGGGSAGLAAAVAAARLGARTLLVERHGLLGGMASAALVHSICGLYRLSDGTQPPVLANGGFAAEFAQRLLASGGATGPVRMGRVAVLLQRPTAFAELADALVRQESDLELRLHTEIVAATVDQVTLNCRGKIETVKARAFIDATGDAALAALRGARCDVADGGRLQRPAFICALAGVAAGAVDDEARLRLARRITQAIKTGRLPGGTLGAHFRASGQEGEAYVTIDLPGGPGFDPLDPACLTRLELEGRELAGRLTQFLRAEVEGFQASYVAAWPARVGVRESRRIVGRYRLEAKDLEKGAQFPDQIAFATWPMELRETAAGPRLRFPSGTQPCGIPLRALQAKDGDALFMAGRCISCSHEAQASIRVIGTCLATGEAAGVAAALTALKGMCSADAVRERIAS